MDTVHASHGAWTFKTIILGAGIHFADVPFFTTLASYFSSYREKSAWVKILFGGAGVRTT